MTPLIASAPATTDENFFASSSSSATSSASKSVEVTRRHATSTAAPARINAAMAYAARVWNREALMVTVCALGDAAECHQRFGAQHFFFNDCCPQAKPSI